MAKILNILHVEDQERDAVLIQRHLAHSEHEIYIERVFTAETMRAKLAEQDWDVILCDYSMPKFSALRALDVLRESGKDIPLIIISGTIGEDIAVAAMRAGANDYLMKDQLARLVPTIEREVAEAAHRRAGRAAEQQLAVQMAALRSAANAIAITDTEGNFTWVNPAFTELTGYQADEVIGKSPRLLRSGRHDAEFYQGLWTTILRGQVWQGEMINRRKDGTIYYEEQTITPVTDASGKIVNFVTIKNDITERRRSREELRQAKAFSDTLIATANVMILGVDPAGNVNIFNKMAEAITGYSHEELSGPDWLDILIPPARFSEVWEEFRRMTTHDIPRIFEGPILTKDGSERYIMWQNSRIVVEGELVEIIAFGNDITGRRHAEQALRSSEERYRDLVENALDIIYTHDLEGRYTSVNDAVERVTGYTVEESIGMSITDSVARDQIEKVREMIAAKLDGKDVTAYELDIIAKDGRRVPVEVNTRIIYENGKAVGVQGIARDITERKQLEEQLRQSQKLESIGRLAGGIAHDFNNMLTAINGYSDLALRQIAADHPVRSHLEEIKKAGERSALLTSQLLAFSRRQVLRLEDVRINDVINDTSNMLKRLIGDDIELETALKPTAGTIRFDPGQLSQILMNLAVNARDAMPDGGKLTIETANVFLDPDYASNHIGVLPGAYVMLSVTDTGIGMTPEVQAQIFEPFFTTKGVGQGTGLGLPTVYGIVTQSGGGIFVYSEVDRGTTFKIYIPRTVDPGEMAAEERSAQRLPVGTETILLAEDNDVVRALSREVLETCGYTVIEAVDGVEALAILEARGEEIALLITDVIMPRIGGRELAEKAAELRPDLPVLFSSGYTDDAIVRNGVLDTNLNFVQKPFNVDDVARKVRDLLDARRK